MDKIKNVTVLMPAYNASNFIGQTIRSILNQTFKEFEFLIIDDGSTDNTEEMLSGFKDSRINYFRINHGGTAAALNYGLENSSYDWVARIDADDLNVPRRLETQINFLEKNPAYDIVSSWSVYFKRSKILFFLKGPVMHDEIYKFLDLHNPLNQSSVMYRKEIINSAKYNENFLFNEDFELFRRVRDKVKFHNIPEYLAYTRVHKNSKSSIPDNQNMYDVLFPEAVKNLLNARGMRELYYWTTICAWTNFFYGYRKESRKYFLSSASFKNFIAYVSTYFPEKYFNAFLNARLRYRFESLFNGKQLYKTELKNLIN